MFLTDMSLMSLALIFSLLSALGSMRVLVIIDVLKWLEVRDLVCNEATKGTKHDNTNYIGLLKMYTLDSYCRYHRIIKLL